MSSEPKTVSLSFDADINQRIEVIYDLLADLRGYGLWLPGSVVFKGTSEVSPGTTVVGTRYIESSPWGIRRGLVTQATRPTLLSFHQPMTLRPEWIGNIDIHLRHNLSSVGAGTRLHRTLDLAITGPARLVSRLIVRASGAENRRMLEKLKIYAESAHFSGKRA